jgi:DNA-binding response OmpR family regulator
MNSKRKKRVLAIDDEPSLTEWLKILLEHAGYEVRTARVARRSSAPGGLTPWSPT